MSKLAFLHGRNRIVGPLEAQLCDAIEQFEPDLVSLDPFVKTHSMSENDNGDMDFVCDLLASIAIDYNIAVDSPHHVHKGTMTPGDADAGRGASGIKDAARLVYTLIAMTEEEAQAFGINPADRHTYVRLDPAKVNIAKHSSVATWFALHSQAIGNGDGDYPNGDSMQVAKPWTQPSQWEGTDSIGLNKVLDEIAAGMDGGKRRYSNAPWIKGSSRMAGGASAVPAEDRSAMPTDHPRLARNRAAPRGEIQRRRRSQNCLGALRQ